MSPEMAISWQIYNALAASQTESPAPGLPLEFIGPKGGSTEGRTTAYFLGAAAAGFYMQKRDQPSGVVERLEVAAEGPARLVRYDNRGEELSRSAFAIAELKLYFNDLLLGRPLEAGEVVEDGRLHREGSVQQLGHRLLVGWSRWRQRRG